MLRREARNSKRKYDLDGINISKVRVQKFTKLLNTLKQKIQREKKRLEEVGHESSRTMKELQASVVKVEKELSNLKGVRDYRLLRGSNRGFKKGGSDEI